MRPPRPIEIDVGVEQFGAGTRTRLRFGDRLIEIREPVDETRLQCLLRQEGTTVTEPTDLLGGELSARRHVLHDRREEIVGERGQRFTLRGGELGLREGVRGGLVLLSLVDARHHLELVERAPQERHLGAQPDQAHFSRRL
jgi:hypothetical protein